jgi:hypothetical protein
MTRVEGGGLTAQAVVPSALATSWPATLTSVRSLGQPGSGAGWQMTPGHGVGTRWAKPDGPVGEVDAAATVGPIHSGPGRTGGGVLRRDLDLRPPSSVRRPDAVLDPRALCEREAAILGLLGPGAGSPTPTLCQLRSGRAETYVSASVALGQ